eukprot:2683825-Rhodomonas_salina.1
MSYAVLSRVWRYVSCYGVCGTESGLEYGVCGTESGMAVPQVWYLSCDGVCGTEMVVPGGKSTCQASSPTTSTSKCLSLPPRSLLSLYL